MNGKRALMLAGLVSAAGLSAAILLAYRVAPVARPRAAFAELAHDFGAVEQGDRLSHTFRLRNDGDAPLTISRVDLSQPAMKSRFPRVVAPGADAGITIEWDTARVRGELAATAIVRMDDPGQPAVMLNLAGSALASIEIEPAPVVFFSAYRDETPEQRVTIVNRDERPLTITSLEPQGAHFVADVTAVEAGQRYEVRVRVPRGLAAGRYRESLRVNTDHPRHPRLSIGVNVFVKEDLYASPELLQFEDVRLAQLQEPRFAAAVAQSVMLRKREGEFRITRVSTDVRGLAVSPSPAAGTPSQAFRLEVGFEGGRTERGPIDGVIRIATDDRAFPEIVIPVKGTIH